MESERIGHCLQRPLSVKSVLASVYNKNECTLPLVSQAPSLLPINTLLPGSFRMPANVKCNICSGLINRPITNSISKNIFIPLEVLFLDTRQRFTHLRLDSITSLLVASQSFLSCICIFMA